MPSTTVYEIAPNLRYEWLAEGRIIVYQFGNHEAKPLGLMMDFILQTMQEWDRSKPYLSIYEASMPMVMFTPYARQRLNEISAAAPDLKGRSAGVIPYPRLQHLLRLYTVLKGQENRAKRMFTNRQEAVRWLLAYADWPK
jgi:hypothetical protein